MIKLARSAYEIAQSMQVWFAESVARVCAFADYTNIKYITLSLRYICINVYLTGWRILCCRGKLFGNLVLVALKVERA